MPGPRRRVTPIAVNASDDKLRLNGKQVTNTSECAEALLANRKNGGEVAVHESLLRIPSIVPKFKLEQALGVPQPAVFVGGAGGLIGGRNTVYIQSTNYY